MKLSNEWKSYECIDAGDGEKLESWNGIILRRPDPQAIWKIEKNRKNVDAHYHRSTTGGGEWEYLKKLPESWQVSYKDLTFKIAPTSFKHTGLFPEQAVNWDYMMDKIKNSKKEIHVLNLFAYTGGATVACSAAGAVEVVHVDSSRGMIEWAKENVKLSHLENNHIRFIQDDCLKFVEREKRRGRKYEAIIMDPPSYGRGPNGEVWKFEDSLYKLIDACMDILSDDAIFLTVNSYTTGVSPIVIDNILRTTILKKFPNGRVEAGEVGLPITRDHLILPCGIYGRWESVDSNTDK